MKKTVLMQIKISDKNREVIESDVNSLIEQGYEPAQCCVND